MISSAIEQSKAFFTLQQPTSATSQSITHKKVIYHIFTNKQAFQSYFSTNNTNMQWRYQLFKCFLESYENSTKQQDDLAAKFATLMEKLNEQNHAKNCVEKVFTYVEEQFTYL